MKCGVGHTDTKAGSADREAIELCLDGLLKKQVDQGRLKFCSLQGHLQAKARPLMYWEPAVNQLLLSHCILNRLYKTGGGVKSGMAQIWFLH